MERTVNDLNAEEIEILDAFEEGRLQRTTQADAELSQHRLIAESTLKREDSIPIRLSSNDLHILQARAIREGVPYQTLASRIVHQYVAGQLVERSANGDSRLP